MRLLSLTLLALTLHCAEETKLPADAQAAVDKADKAISVIQAKADAEIGKIRQGLIVTLTKAQAAVTKKGDLDGANAVKAQIDALEKLTPDLLATPTIKKKEVSNYLIGKWKVTCGPWNNTWIINADGTIAEGEGPRKGTWKLQGKVATVTWITGAQENITLPKDLEVNMADARGTGGVISLERLPDQP